MPEHLVMLLLLLQGGLAVNATGSYRPALRITGMTPGLELHLDDFEVCYMCYNTLLQCLCCSRYITHARTMPLSLMDHPWQQRVPAHTQQASTSTD
jgi:hypothetical protein